MTFDDEWVDQVRRGMKACTVFLCQCRIRFSHAFSLSRCNTDGALLGYPLYWLAYHQMLANLISQSATMVKFPLSTPLECRKHR